jgi:hypothetical protein
MSGSLRFFAFSAGAMSVAVALAAACTDDGAPTTPDAATNTDGSTDETIDASVDARDDAPRDAGRAVKDANGPGEAGDPCSFNRDCRNALRCECDGTCACALGPRGTGQNGVDGCDSGNHCESSVCLEGPGGAFLCSDECLTPADCPPKLPRCENIAFVGRICVRQP